MRRKLFLGLALSALLCLTLALPAIAAEKGPLVTAAELNSLLGQEDVVIVDVRDGAAYAAGHIPGAVSVQKTDFYETIDGIKSMAAGPELFSTTLGRIGAGNDTRIIVYSAAGDLKHATRFWWVLHMYGHQNAHVLDGGLEAWTNAGYELSTEPANPAPAEYTLTAADVNQDTVATNEEVIAAQKAGTTLVDCRNNDYFQGKKTKAARSGSIAGAILIDAGENLNEDGTFKTAEELAQVYAAKGITAGTPVITFCNTGTTATVNYFALTQVLGYSNVQNYDASLTYWAAQPSLPMESAYDFFTIGSERAEVNAALIDLPSAPVKQNSHSFAPADALADGLEVTLAKAGETITLTGPDTSVQLTVGEPMIKINNQEQKIDAAPFTAGGVDFLPIRRVAEAFGAEVSWDAEKQQVSIGLVK